MVVQMSDHQRVALNYGDGHDFFWYLYRADNACCVFPEGDDRWLGVVQSAELMVENSHVIDSLLFRSLFHSHLLSVFYAIRWMAG